MMRATSMSGGRGLRMISHGRRQSFPRIRFDNTTGCRLPIESNGRNKRGAGGAPLTKGYLDDNVEAFQLCLIVRAVCESGCSSRRTHRTADIPSTRRPLLQTTQPVPGYQMLSSRLTPSNPSPTSLAAYRLSTPPPQVARVRSLKRRLRSTGGNRD